MSAKTRALAVFIGRFQPFHDGHLGVVCQALTQAENVLLLCGSANCPRTLKNPFTFAERETMIRSTLSEAENQRLSLMPLDDIPYDDAAWVMQVHQRVAKVAQSLQVKNDEIALIGHKKDASSYYLDYFPDWQWLGVDNIDGISATPLRQRYLRFGFDQANYQMEEIPASVLAWLNDFRHRADYRYLYAEQAAIDADKKAWSVAPYPPIFTTTDALVEHRGEVLLIERGNHPGKGLLAMPGGFLEQEERLLTSCLRELEEETGIAHDESTWQGYLQYQDFYEAPGRSERGRMITHVFYFHLPEELPRPLVKGGDDAAKAMWLPVSALDARDFFDDHYHVIVDMRKKAG